MTTVSIDARTLPKSLRCGLARIDRKIRGFALVRGLGLVAIVLAIFAAVGMALDFAIALPIVVRWAIWISWIAAGTLTLGLAVIGPMFRSAKYADLAAVAERSRPEMGERLSSAVELLGAKGKPHGSPALIAALADDAAKRASEAGLSDAVSGRRAAGMLLAGALAAGLVFAPSFARPDPFAALANRFLMPWADVERASRFVVAVTPGDAVVAVGSDVSIVATIRPRFGPMTPPESGRLEWTGSDGVQHAAIMAVDKASEETSRGFRLTLPKVAETTRYKVVIDSAESRKHRLTAVDPPSVAKLAARVEPPSYTKIAASNAKSAARIEAWEGSTVRLTLTANKPIASARLDWPIAPETRSSADATKGIAMTTSDGGTTWGATVSAEVSGNYLFALEDEHKLVNRPEPARRLVVKPDAPPTIVLGGSPDPKDAQGDDLLIVEILARDDLAVMTCDFLYVIERSASSGSPDSERKELAAKVAGLGSRVARGEASLGLKPLALRSGDILSYQVRVTDSRPAPRGPNVTFSAIRSLRIVDKAEPLLTRERSIERQSLQDQLTALKTLAAENRQGAEALRYVADAAGRGNGKWDDERQADLTRREASARSVVEKLRELARDFADSEQFSALERPARQIADVEAEGGRETLDAARQAADAARRLAELRTADDRLAAVQVRLDELQRQFDERAKLDDDRRKLRELAEKQEALARRAEELAKSGDRGELEKIQQEQDRLRAEADELARRSPELRAEALAARAKEAEDLAKKARELANRQREEARKTGDPTSRAAMLKELAEAQKRVEDDARRLAMKVDRPLEENGRARLDAAALARPIEPLERGEIEPGRQRLDEAQDTLRRLARDLDDVRDDPKALARRLAKRQDALRNQVAETIAQARDPDEKKALADALKPFAARQAAIAQLAAALPVPNDLKAQAKEAVAATERSTKDLNENKNKQVLNHQNEARDRLNRLADALPDLNNRRQQAMQAMHEAKNRTDQVARELDEHLRATAPRPDQKDFDPDAAARDLARRVAPLADRQAEAVRHLADVQPDRDAEPQRDRALDRAQHLADALDALRAAAPPESTPTEVASTSGWRLLGAFDDARKFPPFAIDRPIDLKAAFEGRKKTHPTWKPVDPGPDGKFDLGAMFSKEDNICAFGYVEIMSPTKGRGRLIIGSDDTLAIWLNGKRVYDFNNGRSYGPDQDRVDVTFAEGPNRMLVRCGNVNSEWAFSIKVQTPKPPDLARKAEGFQRLREKLPSVKTDATAAIERLEQKMTGREPADDRATEMAAELKAAPNAELPDAMPAVAAALRNLKTPDAVPQRAEAIRRADLAAKAQAEHRPDAAKAREDVAKAVEALAHRMTDTDSPRERAEALAEAQRGLNEPNAPRDAHAQAEAQTAIANEVAALESASPKAPPAREATRRAAEMADRQIHRPDAAPSPSQMAEARTTAAEAISEFAKSADAESQPHPAPNASPREGAKALADRQRDLAKRAAELADRAPKGDAAKIAAELASLAKDQKAVAQAARDVTDPHPAGAQPRRDAEAARDQARAAQAKAAGALAAHDPAQAAAAAKMAAEALDRLAEKLPTSIQPRPGTPADPELAVNAAHAGEARDLARRERSIRERLQALMADRVEPQEKLRDDSVKLGHDLANLRDGTRDVSQKSQGPANAAAEILQNQAPPIMNEGAQHLAAGRADPARESQRRAAETLERAAQQAEDLAAALRSEAPAEAMAQAQERAEGQDHEPGEGKPHSGEGLASAREAQRQASRDLAQARESQAGGEHAAAKSASSAMHQAASGLRAAAAPSRGKPGKPHKGQASETAERDPKEGEAGRDDAHLAELKEQIKARTGRNWGELPGHLRSEILQMSNGKYRDDYARLIGLYFREIAAGRDDAESGGKK